MLPFFHPGIAFCARQMANFHKITRRTVAECRKRSSLLVKTALLLLWLTAPAHLHADTISGRVADPSGAVIVGARIEITGGDLSQPIVLSSDGQGKFSSPDLKPGAYLLRITQE